jgi:hypothetical protein
MKDTELTTQEKQKRIQEILNSNMSRNPSSATEVPVDVDTNPDHHPPSASSLPREGVLARVSTISRSQDRGALKGRAATSDRSARAPSGSVSASRQTATAGIIVVTVSQLRSSSYDDCLPFISV